MAQLKIFLTTLLFFLLKLPINSQNLRSPCPELFTYTGPSNQTSGWYGTITLRSDVELSGVWLRLTFDRPGSGLEHSFGETETSDGKEYFIEKPNFKLNTNVPHTFSFFLKYKPNEQVPQLVSFTLNGKMVCPEHELAGRDDICGTVIPRPRTIDTNNEIIHEGEFPWNAALYHAKDNNLDYICQASLISKYHVITVAHCVVSKRSQTPLDADSVVVYLGKYYLKRFSSPGIQDRQVSQILTHPQYNAETYENDIALLEFKMAADFTDYVRPVCLWQESTDLSSVLNKEGSVVGWGFGETGKLTEQLTQLKMLVVSLETCIMSYPDFYSRFTSSNTYCAGFRNETSVCNGDSGGGMVFPKANLNRNNPVWQLRGVVSSSVALENQFKCEASNYVVFTDTTKYLGWIKKSMVK